MGETPGEASLTALGNGKPSFKAAIPSVASADADGPDFNLRVIVSVNHGSTSGNQSSQIVFTGK